MDGCCQAAPVEHVPALYQRPTGLALWVGAGPSVGPVGYDVGMGHTRHLTWGRVLAAAMIAVYAVFSASAVRYADPELKSDTRSPALTRTVRRPKRASLEKGRVENGGSPLRALARKARRAPTRVWGVCLAATAMAMPAGRPRRERALRRRWSALGGHGRNGPGLTV